MRTQNQIETQNDQCNTSVMTGIDEVKTKITIDDKIFICKIKLLITTGKNRGVHMSRLIETLEKVTRMKHSTFQSFNKILVHELFKVHPFTDYFLRIETDYAVERQTPVTHKPTTEVHSCLYESSTNYASMTVFVNGSSACPHAQANNENNYTHIQRSTIALTNQVTRNIKPHELSINYLSFPKLIGICESCFSSPVYTLLKTVDEQAVVNKINTNPLFVEDIARLIENNTNALPGEIFYKVTNMESIHNHNVVATNVFPFNKITKQTR